MGWEDTGFGSIKKKRKKEKQSYKTVNEAVSASGGHRPVESSDTHDTTMSPPYQPYEYAVKLEPACDPADFGPQGGAEDGRFPLTQGDSTSLNQFNAWITGEGHLKTDDAETIDETGNVLSNGANIAFSESGTTERKEKKKRKKHEVHDSDLLEQTVDGDTEERAGDAYDNVNIGDSHVSMNATWTNVEKKKKKKKKKKRKKHEVHDSDLLEQTVDGDTEERAGDAYDNVNIGDSHVSMTATWTNEEKKKKKKKKKKKRKKHEVHDSDLLEQTVDGDIEERAGNAYDNVNIGDSHVSMNATWTNEKKKKTEDSDMDQTVNEDIIEDRADGDSFNLSPMENGKAERKKKKKKKKKKERKRKQEDHESDPIEQTSNEISQSADGVNTGESLARVINRFIVNKKKRKLDAEFETMNKANSELAELLRYQDLRSMWSGKTPVCYLCQLELVDEDYKDHLSRVHSRLSYNCPKCRKALSSKEVLARHMTSTCRRKGEETMVTPFRCQLCPMAYNNMRGWRDHMNREHWKTSLPAKRQCPHCRVVFSSTTKAANHAAKCAEGTLRNQTTRQDNVECLDCGKLYSSRSSLAHHNELIHQQRIYLCPCDKPFRGSSDYYRHIATCPQANRMPVAKKDG